MQAVRYQIVGAIFYSLLGVTVLLLGLSVSLTGEQQAHRPTNQKKKGGDFNGLAQVCG